MINVCLDIVTIEESMLVNVIASEIEESLCSFQAKRPRKVKEKRGGGGGVGEGVK